MYQKVNKITLQAENIKDNAPCEISISKNIKSSKLYHDPFQTPKRIGPSNHITRKDAHKLYANKNHNSFFYQL